MKDGALIEFAQALHDINPSLAQDFGAIDSSSRDSATINRGISLAMARNSPESAVKFLEDLYSQDRNRLFTGIGSLINSGLLAPDYVLSLSKNYHESLTPETLGKNLFKAWRNTEPGASPLDYSDRLARRTGMWDSFATEYVRDDYVGASEWAANLPKGSTKDEVSFALARGIVSTFPADSLKWSLSIQNPEQRRIAVEMVIGSARLHDPENSRIAIENAEISAGERELFLKHFSTLGNKN